MRVSTVRTQFVEYIPSVREEGVLYVSTTFRTAVHNCACGCGNKVVTPIDPARWHFSWDGIDATLSPSVGNWVFPCQSHYLIQRGGVNWSTQWSEKQIRAGALRDREARTQQFAGPASFESTPLARFVAPIRRALRRIW